jgi:hypothetical protein
MSAKKKGLTPAERKRIKYVCDWEGFDYAFLMKTEFPEIKDPEFHRLRKAFCELARY